MERIIKNFEYKKGINDKIIKVSKEFNIFFFTTFIFKFIIHISFNVFILYFDIKVELI